MYVLFPMLMFLSVFCLRLCLCDLLFFNLFLFMINSAFALVFVLYMWLCLLVSVSASVFVLGFLVVSASTICANNRVCVADYDGLFLAIHHALYQDLQ